MNRDAAAAAEEPVPLQLSQANIHDATLRVLENGVYEVLTTGPDPYVFTEPVAQPHDPRSQYVLAVEYFSATGADHFQVFVDPPISEARSVKGIGLSHSEGWTTYAIDLQPALQDSPIKRLRLDFGSHAGKSFQIRSLLLRPRTEQEARLAARRVARREAEKAQEIRLRKYLSGAYPGRVTQVTVNETQIAVKGEILGKRRGNEAFFLAEAPLFADITELRSFPDLQPISPDARGRFSRTLDRQRKATDGTGNYDRLLSRWAIVRKDGSSNYTLVSYARYADAVRSRANLPDEKPRNKKGLGGFHTSFPVSDLEDLGIAAVTVNVVLNGLIFTTPGPGRTAFSYGGRTWYSGDARVAQMDKTLLEAAKRRAVVSAILLIGQAGNAPTGDYSRLIAHPDADPAGIFAMPDVSSEAGLTAYAAGVNFLAERYSRPDSRYGRIHHWILHNEVNAGWVWTNAGEKTALLYLDLYHRSMRVAHLIARQYDPNARAFISLEHHWTMKPTAQSYAGRDLLDLLTELSRAEGDFDWAIAFHPYPQNLFDPRVWADHEVDFTFDTPKITFKNVEVLDAWVKQPRMLFQNKRRRVVHLTEQGLNSRDYSEQSLRDQAAGMAYAWNKIKRLDTIEVFHYHNWVDNRGEGGLRIGLRRFPDDRDEPLGKKPIWFVYRDLGTDAEEATNAFAKAIIGIQDWSEVRQNKKGNGAK